MASPHESPEILEDSFHGTRVLRRLVRIRLELATRDVVGVLLDVGVPLLGQVVQREDRRNGTDRNAGAESMHSTGSMKSWSTASNPGRRICCKRTAVALLR